MNSEDLKLLDEVAKRFEQDYFIRSLGEFGLFCMPNFVITAENGKLLLKLLEHVSAQDEEMIRSHLAGLPYEILPERMTLEDIERITGARFPDLPE